MNVPLRVALCATLLAAPASAQRRPNTFWWVPSTLGYGAMGAMGVGAVEQIVDAARFYRSGDVLSRRSARNAAWTGFAIGSVFGFAHGVIVDGRIHRGDEVTPRQRRSMSLATIMTGVAAGSLVSYSVLRRDGRNGQYYFERPTQRIPEALVVAAAGPAIGAILAHQVVKVGDHTLRNEPPRIEVVPGARGATLLVELTVP